MTDLTPLFQFFLSLIVLILTTFVVPYFKRKTTEKDRETMLKWVEIAVYAAQQLMYESSGADRKEYVRNFLNAKGYDINSQEVDAAIEAAVLKLHSSFFEIDVDDEVVIE